MITVPELINYLSQAYFVSLRAKSLHEKILEYKDLAMKQTSAWSETPSGGRTGSSPQAVWIEKMIETQELLSRTETKLLDKERKIREIIEFLPDELEKGILEDYHLNRMEIGYKYSYDERQIRRIRNRAYNQLVIILNQTGYDLR